MRKLKNHLARTNKDMREELMSYIKQNSDVVNGSAKQKNVEDMWNTLMMWGDEAQHVDDEEGDDEYDEQTFVQNNISDDNGYNSIQFVKNYLENFIKIFPSIILNEVDYDEIKVPK
jgi:hypothetical protein